jgi:predicted transcriptional regulator
MLPTPKEFRHLRKKAGLTQKRLAHESGVSQSLIARIEKGDIDTRLSTAEKILSVIRKTESKRPRVHTLSDIMASPVLYCRPNDPLRRAAQLMLSNGISQIPIMEEGRPIGSISDSQILNFIANKGSRAASMKLSETMSKPFPQLNFGEPIDKAVSMLSKNSAVLIMRGEHVAGVVTKADVLRNMT